MSPSPSGLNRWRHSGSIGHHPGDGDAEAEIVGHGPSQAGDGAGGLFVREDAGDGDP